MQTFTALTRFSLIPLLILVFAACGDVGDAPQAQTGDAVAVTTAEGDVLPIDTSRSTVKWRAAKVTRAHDGGFHIFDGTVTLQDEQVTGVNLNIDTRSIWSDTERLTNHLKSEDFFEVEAYPTATFEANQIVPTDSAQYTHLVTGNLTMHGVTHGITFPVALVIDETYVQAEANFIIDRRNWNINYKGQADDLIENEVRLIFDLVAQPNPETQPTADNTVD